MSTGYTLQINVSDSGASQEIQKIDTRLQKLGKTTKTTNEPFMNLSKSLQKFGDLSAINTLNGGINTIQASVLGLTKSLPGLGEAMGLAFGAAGIEQFIQRMTQLTLQTAKWANQINSISGYTGLTPQQVQYFQNAGKISGIGADKMVQGVSDLDTSISDANLGDTTKQIAFRTLGIKTGTWANPASGASTLQTLLDKLANFKASTPEATATQRRILGQEIGLSPELIQLAGQGQKAVDQYFSEAQSQTNLTDKQIADDSNLEKSVNLLKTSFDTLNHEVGSEFAPALTNLINAITAGVNWLNGLFDPNKPSAGGGPALGGTGGVIIPGTDGTPAPTSAPNNLGDSIYNGVSGWVKKNILGDWQDDAKSLQANILGASPAQITAMQNMYKQLTQGGLSSTMAQGIITNAFAESSMNPNVRNGAYYGLFQDSPERITAFKKANPNVDITTASGQTQMLLWELHNTKIGKQAYQQMLNSRTVGDAAEADAQYAERPGGYAPQIRGYAAGAVGQDLGLTSNEPLNVNINVNHNAPPTVSAVTTGTTIKPKISVSGPSEYGFGT